MKPKEPVQEFFSIGDVCTLTDLKPHVLRYWRASSSFFIRQESIWNRFTSGARSSSSCWQTVLYTEKYTIDGARQKIDEYRKSGELRSVARSALDRRRSSLWRVSCAPFWRFSTTAGREGIKS